MAATTLYLWPRGGQSNDWGQGTTTYTVAGRHFRLRPSGLVEAIGPGNLPLNVKADHPYGGGFEGVRNDDRYSGEGALLDALAAGIVGVHMTIPCAANGTGSNDWVNTLTTSPVVPSSAGYAAAAKMMTQLGVQFDNAKIGGYIIYQGESNANPAGASTAAEWGPDWDAFCDEVSTFHPAASWATNGGSGKKFCFIGLPPTQPTDLPNATDWGAVGTAQSTLVSTTRLADADCILVPSPDPSATVTGEDFHLETAALVSLYTSIGEAIVANWGLT